MNLANARERSSESGLDRGTKRKLSEDTNQRKSKERTPKDHCFEDFKSDDTGFQTESESSLIDFDSEQLLLIRSATDKIIEMKQVNSALTV